MVTIAEGDKAEYIKEIIEQLHRMANPQLATILAVLRDTNRVSARPSQVQVTILKRDLQSRLQTD